ncbi:MAG: EAL domain-containing protein [bacterium]|nr:EAL domain-containing protein [bacterium]
MQEDDDRLRSLAGHFSPLGLIIVDEELRIRCWNTWIERVSEELGPAARGELLSKIFGIAVAEPLIKRIKRSLDAGSSSLLSTAFHPHPLPLADTQFPDRKMIQRVSISGFSDDHGARFAAIHVLDVSKEVARERRFRDQGEELRERGQELDKARLELQKQNRNLQFMANHCVLTGLPNRCLFEERLDRALGMAHRRKNAMAVLFIDLDRFKSINDTVGHAAGDAVLITVAERLELLLRSTDTAARFGGDEFGVLLAEVADQSDAGKVAERIRNLVREPIHYEGQFLEVGCSIGISCSPMDGDDSEALISRADSAMYRAKQQGLGTSFYTPELHQQGRRIMELERELAHAMEQRQLCGYYQPQVQGSDGTIVGVEALLRWHHPELGNISPGEFIPVAENLRLMPEIGAWVLEESCRQSANWQAAGLNRVPISVNVSPAELHHEDFSDRVLSAISKAGVEGRDIVLEITETILVEDSEAARMKLEPLRDLGLRIAVDDFGSGFSNLSLLAELPLDILKLDRSLISYACDHPRGEKIARAALNLAASIGLETVAEGVETDTQRELLLNLGFDIMQGFLFATPAPPDDVTSWLRAGRLSVHKGND